MRELAGLLWGRVAGKPESLGVKSSRPMPAREPVKTGASKTRRHCTPIASAVHFVSFRDDRYWNAVKVWGRPHFIHRGWDLRAQREIADEDIVVFASGPHDQEPSIRSFNDIVEGV